MVDTIDIGSVIEGRYRLISRIGEGGFGSVYRAIQLATEQSVAVKVLTPTRSADTDLARFERELKLIAQLKHPNIVGLIDSGVLPGGRDYFIVLEFIEGEPLDRYIARNGPLTVRQAIRLMTQTAEVLRYAHARGVVHRDFKPQNIMVMEPGDRLSAKVLDFGIAGILEGARTADYKTLTEKNAFPGTPAYMAPEQLDHKPLTPQTDLYAWGLVFLECLSGAPVMGQDSAIRIIFKQVSEDPVPIPDAVRDSPLGPLLTRATSKSLATRHKDADALLSEIEAINPNHDGFEPLNALIADTEPRGLSPEQLAELASTTGGFLEEDFHTLPATDINTHPAHLEAEPTDAHDTNRSAQPPADTPTDVSHAIPGSAPSPSKLPLLIAAVALIAIAIAAAVLLSQSDDDTTTDEGNTDPASAAPLAPCPIGQERSEMTRDHCCWPGQVWHNDKARCFGPPDSCPPNHVPREEECVPDVARGTGSLVIQEISPPDAQILINGTPRGTPPLTLDALPMGGYAVVISAPGFVEHVVSVELTAENPGHTLSGVGLAQRGDDLPPGMVTVPAGSFWMGCATHDTRCDASEQPGRNIHLDAYAIDRTEVTVADFQACVEGGPCKAPESPNEEYICNYGVAGRSQHPINCVTWYQAEMYCDWRGKRLPTEAEWEKAARGTRDQRIHPWGDQTPDCTRTVLEENGKDGCGNGTTLPVWSRPLGANELGVYGLGGNVEEWTSDRYDPVFLQNAPDANPRSSASSSDRVVRDAGYDDSPAKSRLSRRDSESPASVDDDLGFRCAKSL